MRTELLMLIVTLSLVASASTEAAPNAWPALAATVLPSDAAKSNQAATWSQPLTFENSVDLPGLSCDDFKREWRFVLLQLGARASDLNIDSNRYCGLSATFSVLVPVDKTGKNAADAVTQWRWQTIELRTGTVVSGKLLTFRNTPTSQLQGAYDRTCPYFVQVTNKILPLFATRDVKLIPHTVCEKYGVGLRAQILMPAPQEAASR
jgi:hypothetical protein